VLVVVIIVRGMAVAVVHVVSVIAVLHLFMTALRAMDVGMRFGRHVHVGRAFVVVAVVGMVGVTIVHVVDVAGMFDAGVAAARGVSVVMPGVRAVFGGGGHCVPPCCGQLRLAGACQASYTRSLTGTYCSSEESVMRRLWCNSRIARVGRAALTNANCSGGERVG
jgi:hypothetical protein